MDMFLDIDKVKEIQKELDKVIQDGVRSIIRLIRASAAHISDSLAVPDNSPWKKAEVNNRILSFEDLPVENQEQLPSDRKVPGQRRMRGSKALGNRPAEVQPDVENYGQDSLATRLVRGGHLSKEVLKQLEKEWQIKYSKKNVPATKRNHQNVSKGSVIEK